VPPQPDSVLQVPHALDGEVVLQYPGDVVVVVVVPMAATCGQHWLFELQSKFITMPFDPDPTEVTLVALASVEHEQDDDGQKEGTLLQLLSHQASVPELVPFQVQTLAALRRLMDLLEEKDELQLPTEKTPVLLLERVPHWDCVQIMVCPFTVVVVKVVGEGEMPEIWLPFPKVAERLPGNVLLTPSTVVVMVLLES